MIDLHCHILPGIYVALAQASINMATIAAKDGIETIVAMRPCQGDSPFSCQAPGTCLTVIRLGHQNIPVKILLGGDVFALLSPSYYERLYN